MKTKLRFFSFIFLSITLGFVSNSQADPCGMVPPIFTGAGSPITRIGLQQTYVFYKDGVESFVIRPGFQGKVDNFGMLIPFPNPPSLRKVPDNVFAQIAAGIEPPEVVVDCNPPMPMAMANGAAPRGGGRMRFARKSKSSVQVLKQEAVGMYEVAVLSAGSAEALKKWMDKNGFQYPKGMDEVTSDYIKIGWCFVAVKTKVGQNGEVQPKPGQRKIKADLPNDSVFDGNVQGMGFRFKTDELVVPMRLSAFNEGDLRNVVYLLTDGPRKIRAIPEEYVVRQIPGKQLVENLTKPLPLRIIGGGVDDIPERMKKGLPKRRDPAPHNGVAKLLFASDLQAINQPTLSLKHEETEKQLLAVGEHFGLRGAEIDLANDAAIKDQASEGTDKMMAVLETMTMTVVDGDFPREVLAKQNLKFDAFKMASKRNTREVYDTKIHKQPRKATGLRVSSYSAEQTPAMRRLERAIVSNSAKPKSNSVSAVKPESETGSFGILIGTLSGLILMLSLGMMVQVKSEN